MQTTSADGWVLSRRSFVTGALCAAPMLSTAQVLRKETPMRLYCIFAEQNFTVALNDSPAARDLVTLLPLDLTIEDYANNEKMAYLPRKLTEVGAAPISDPAVGDVCTYAP